MRDKILPLLLPHLDRGLRVIDLPSDLLDPDALAIMDDDKLIEWGCRRHDGPNHDGTVPLLNGWEFVHITGPNRKPIEVFLAEVLSEQPQHPDLAIRVRLTAAGQLEARRIRIAINSTSPPIAAGANFISQTSEKQSGLPISAAPMKKTGVDEIVIHLKAMQSDNNNQQPIGVSANQIAKVLKCSPQTVLKAMRLIGWIVDSPKVEKATTHRRRTVGGQAGLIALEGVASNRAAFDPSELTESDAKAKISSLNLRPEERDAILQQLVAGETTPAVAVNIARELSEGRARTPPRRAHGKTSKN
ncbi:MAG: hypothetical protein JWP89_2669 [Schlesneria sp.]|nr:hypothetical protein [Schlesneria sp.]